MSVNHGKPTGMDMIKDIDHGRTLGFERLGLHHVTLLPGTRSSIPHAESHEEEFVYVVKGRPHLWLDGYLHELSPGWAVGFPAGTGRAHSFLNNSGEPVELFAAGERTKAENKYVYVINPELQDEHAANWWHEAPRHPLGPHNGLPDRIDAAHVRPIPKDVCVFAPGIEKRSSFHYSGDTETFGLGARLTDALGLKALGIWHDILLPGTRSSWPHAHTHEEEFIFILEGNPSLWLNGEIREMKPGDSAGFKPGTNEAHCLINDTTAPVVNLIFGETRDFENEKIHYPMHPLRNRECARIGAHWTDRPEQRLGNHDGKPRQPSKK